MKSTRSEALIKAQKKYRDKTFMNIALKLHRENDKDIIELLESVENKQGLIKDLLRKEVESRQKSSDLEHAKKIFDLMERKNE